MLSPGSAGRESSADVRDPAQAVTNSTMSKAAKSSNVFVIAEDIANETTIICLLLRIATPAG
jgi:hypothetical protein|tara:strand:+ start:497 stop:682 length:186 start_codon:yes stop_codon:yes gene_type:complete